MISAAAQAAAEAAKAASDAATSKAVIDTAKATWALVGVTVVLAVVTFLAVAVALGGPWLERRAHRKDRQREDEANDEAIRIAVRQALGWIDTARTLLVFELLSDPAATFELINRTLINIRILKHCLRATIHDNDLRLLTTVVLQSLFETRTGLRRLLPENRGVIAPENAFKTAVDTVDAAIFRAAIVAERLGKLYGAFASALGAPDEGAALNSSTSLD